MIRNQTTSCPYKLEKIKLEQKLVVVTDVLLYILRKPGKYLLLDVLFYGVETTNSFNCFPQGPIRDLKSRDWLFALSDRILGRPRPVLFGYFLDSSSYWPIWDRGSGRNGLSPLHLKGLLSNCYGQRLNVPRNTLKYFLSAKSRISITIRHIIKRCVSPCQNRANLGCLTIWIYIPQVKVMQIMRSFTKSTFIFWFIFYNQSVILLPFGYKSWLSPYVGQVQPEVCEELCTDLKYCTPSVEETYVQIKPHLRRYFVLEGDHKNIFSTLHMSVLSDMMEWYMKCGADFSSLECARWRAVGRAGRCFYCSFKEQGVLVMLFVHAEDIGKRLQNCKVHAPPWHRPFPGSNS